jgi:RND family efflux transporter MFP subunit
LAVLGLGLLVSKLLTSTAPQPDVQERVSVAPVVRVATVAPETLRLNVVAHGTVLPRTESDLVAEVRGRIVSVAPALVAGGFFESGDVLLELDDREHQISVERARAQVQLRKSEAELAWADARRRRQLAGRGAASAADLEQFESRGRVAQAALEEARAALRQTELDLERTVVRAPFDGRVRDRSVDLGQFVNPGGKLARIYAVDYAEARLPVATEDLEHLDLDLGFAPSAGSIGSTPITLRARLGGQDLEWPATLVRSEGEIDLRTRTLHLVARVDDPYGRHTSRVSPLPSGLFVEAEIEGRELNDIFVLPASALRDGEVVYIVDAEERLGVRPVDVIRQGRDKVVIRSGLFAGERVVVSPLRAVSEGMSVRVAEVSAS